MTTPTAPEAAPEAETEQELPPDNPVNLMSDEDIQAAIAAEFANRPEPPRTTIKDIFEQSVALVAAATGKANRNGFPRVSEVTATKLYELALGWALQNRGGAPSHDILPPDALNEPTEEAALPPFEPDEVIEAAPDQE